MVKILVLQNKATHHLREDAISKTASRKRRLAKLLPSSFLPSSSMPARLSRRAAAEPVEERPGSGQSPASRAKDLAAQPALLAGIAKKAPIHGGKRVSKATYSFARAAAATSKPPSRRSAARTSKARRVGQIVQGVASRARALHPCGPERVRVR